MLVRMLDRLQGEIVSPQPCGRCKAKATLKITARDLQNLLCDLPEARSEHTLQGTDHHILSLRTGTGFKPSSAYRSDQKELKKWEKATLKLAALASLTGCPQVSKAHSLLTHSDLPIPALASNFCGPWKCETWLDCLSCLPLQLSLRCLS